MKPYEKYIKKEDVEKIHKISMDILENVGVKFEDEYILDVFKEHGARIDGDIVYINQKIFEAAMQTVPSEFTIRSGKGDVHTVSYTHLDVYKRQFFRCIPLSQWDSSSASIKSSALS